MLLALLASSTSEQRIAAIRAAAELIEQNRSSLLAANAKIWTPGTSMLAGGEITAATFERLRLTDKKIAEMTRSMLAVAELPDPVGRVLQRTELDAELVLEKITCPLGVLAVIFEARPDAVTQISALGLKSANAVILKAGREVEHTAQRLVEIIRQALTSSGLPEDAVTWSRAANRCSNCSACPTLIDMVIPRGSKQLVEFVQANTRIPVLGHAEGVATFMLMPPPIRTWRLPSLTTPRRTIQRRAMRRRPCWCTRQIAARFSQARRTL